MVHAGQRKEERGGTRTGGVDHRPALFRVLAPLPVSIL
jgi:hypothetical protein